MGVAVVGSIKKDYGANPDVTGLWNTTMDLVGKLFLITDNTSINYNFILIVSSVDKNWRKIFSEQSVIYIFKLLE